jgi:predicted enzyme related to lactoylglutathione lyase
MIRGIHGLLYSTDPEATRQFFKDAVKLPGSDVGEGWWIFDFPEGDLGVHPVEDPADAGTHDVSFYCDDIQGTVAELRGRGVEFTSTVEDHGYGLVTHFTAPGGIRIQLYEPRYVKGSRRPGRKRAPARRSAARLRARKKRR